MHSGEYLSSVGDNEKKAMAEIKRLSKDARFYLQDRLRNPMQVIRGGIDGFDMEAVDDGLQTLDFELRRVGL